MTNTVTIYIHRVTAINLTSTLCCNYKYAAYSVTVGFEETAYTVTEVDGYQLACFKVLSGDLAGRELEFDYSTSSGTASKLFTREYIQ